jgi:hypothetical protein
MSCQLMSEILCDEPTGISLKSKGLTLLTPLPKNYQKHLWTEASRAGLVPLPLHLLILSGHEIRFCGGENNFPDPIIPNSATSKKESLGEI